MAKYIDIYQAEEVLKRQPWLNKTDLITAVGALKLLVPAADVAEVEQLRSYERTIVKLNEALQEKQEVKHGRWVKENNRPKSEVFICSECNLLAYSPWTGNRRNAKPNICHYNYCPNCGSRMDLDEVEE
jgi:hypothetical protein